MVKKTHASRFSPAYLATRHAGWLFFFIALGLLAGTAWRTLVQPTEYESETGITASLSPASEAEAFDWDGRRREWSALLADPREARLLTNNLRHLYKLALTRDMRLDDTVLRDELEQFRAPQEFSAALFRNPYVAHLGPTVTVSRNDLVANLDFQSLAAIISDLDPPRDADNWDFSFFDAVPADALRTGMVVRPGPDDRFFRVFYHLHDIANPGGPAASPEEAWRTAVDKVVERVEREAQFAGGGGFGANARRELMAEIAAIPALAANGIYHAGVWFHGDGDFRDHPRIWQERWARRTAIDVQWQGVASANLTATAALRLYPLASPRDTSLTRLPPLMAATALAHLSARASSPPTTTPAAAPAPAPEPEPIPEPVAEPPPAPTEAPAEVVLGLVQTVDEEARARHDERRRELETALREARLGLGDAQRRLEAAREHERRLTVEAIAARTRADRLSERYDAAGVLGDRDRQPETPPEVAKLLAAREAAVERLAALLQYCTDEHPFVREVRRELDALDVLLAGHTRETNPTREAEARATRLANLYIEWETAKTAADNLEERRRRLTEAADCILGEVADAEKLAVELEAQLAGLGDPPAPAPRATVVIAPVPEPPQPPPPPKPTPAPVIAPPQGPALSFSTVSRRPPLISRPPSLLAPLAGLLAGLALGLAWIAARELLAKRFADAGAAKRMLRLPILAALPAYDAQSYRDAAKAMKGELSGTKPPAMAFTPSPVDFAEPAPAARREKLRTAGRRPRLAPWAAGVVFLALAAALHWFAGPALSRPQPGFPRDLVLPSTIDRLGEFGHTEDWGELP